MHCFLKKSPFSSIHYFNKYLIQCINPINKMKLYRKIHKTSHVNIKMYFEYENNYAYSIMEKQGYAQKIFEDFILGNTIVSEGEFEVLVQKKWNDNNPQELIDSFIKLADYAKAKHLCISNKMFDNFIDKFTDSMKHFTDDQLLQIFDLFLKWPETESIRTRNYIEIWTALDDTCIARMSSWSDDKQLQFITKFFQLNVTKVSDYCRKSINKLATKSNRLTPAQLVRTMFFIGIVRKAPFDMHNLEVQLEKVIDELTVEELSIIAMGFFKSKTLIRNVDIVCKLIDKIIENSKTIHEVSLAALLKVIRLSMRITHDDRVEYLLDALSHEVPRLSLMCCVHVALVGTSTLTLHKECLDEIAKVCLQKIDKTRVKDIERLIFAFGTLNYRPSTADNLFDLFIDQLRRPDRETEINKHSRSFICSLSFLGMLDLHPKDLIHKALDPSFLLHTFGKQVYDYGREVLVLHNKVMVYFPELDINRLSDKTAKLLSNKYTDYVPVDNGKYQLNMSERMVVDVINILKKIRGGPDYVFGGHILTSYQRGDLILCNDETGSPVPIKDFPKDQFGKVIRPPNDNTWIVLIIAGRNTMIKKYNIVTGPFQCKAKELRALGYKVGMVQWNDWSRLSDELHKTEYINNILSNVN